MLPTFTPSYDSSWSDSIPTFGKPRPSIPVRRQTKFYVDKRPTMKEEKKKVEPKLTPRILPTWLISKFAAYPWVGDKEVTQDHYRAPVLY
jgi:hypothetical protein